MTAPASYSGELSRLGQASRRNALLSVLAIVLVALSLVYSSRQLSRMRAEESRIRSSLLAARDSLARLTTGIRLSIVVLDSLDRRRRELESTLATAKTAVAAIERELVARRISVPPSAQQALRRASRSVDKLSAAIKQDSIFASAVRDSLGTIRPHRPKAAGAEQAETQENTAKDVSSITVTNTSRNVGGRWNWTIYVQAPADVLDRLACVEYTLHKTYPNNVRRVCAVGDRTRPFGLSSSGWAPTHVGIRLTFRNGVEHRLSHTLVFEP